MTRRLLSLRPLLICLLAGLLFVGCSKYEEGPTFSLQSKQARITKGWTAYQLFRNNIDETLFYETYVLVIRDNGTFEWQFGLKDDPAGVIAREGSWKFISLKGEIQLTFNEPDPDTDQEILVKQIKRLESDDLWLLFFYRGDYYEIQFN